MRKMRAAIVQQSAWNTSLETMPLAAGYMKAAAVTDDVVRDHYDIEILNFRGGESGASMARALLDPEVPAVVAFSVFGWNLPQFGALAETIKAVDPSALVIWGGTHVAHQSESMFRRFPHVDIVANGEGDFLYAELLRHHLDPMHGDGLRSIRGISFRGEDGEIITTPPRDRIDDLDSIPSPFLTGSMPMTDVHGRFRYDVALLETNRGCPYRCSFCYWGGAVGQRVREFSRERLQAELEFVAHHEVDTVVLCDANFGMRSADAQFVEDFIRTKVATGYPRSLESSWAKNKSQTFYDIVRRMKEHGLKSSFTLALQTLDPDTLHAMERRNMQLNEWEEVVRFLAELDMDIYAELIWGAPGETPQTFLEGYDRLAVHMSRIAVYPLLLLPNTGYFNDRERHGFVTVRGDVDDFEYVLATGSSGLDEHLDMHRFMFWARGLAEHGYFRYIWSFLRLAANMTQSQVLLDIADWFERSNDRAAIELLAIRRDFTDSDLVTDVVRYLYNTPATGAVFDEWWHASIVPRLAPEWQDVARDVYRYDCLVRPMLRPGPEDEVVLEGGSSYAVRRNELFSFDVVEFLAALRRGDPWVVDRQAVCVDIYYPQGFEHHIENHETAAHYCGEVRRVDSVLT